MGRSQTRENEWPLGDFPVSATVTPVTGCQSFCDLNDGLKSHKYRLFYLDLKSIFDLAIAIGRKKKNKEDSYDRNALYLLSL